MALLDILHAARVDPIQSFSILVILTPFIYIIANEVVRKQARVSGLGGPTGLPVIGNLWHIRKNAAETYRQWARTYGAVYQIQLGNIPVVVVNSAASAKVLFGQNAQALSSRPEFYTFHKVPMPCLCVLVPLLMTIGPLKYCRNNDRYLSLQRVTQKTKERRGVSPESTFDSNIHTALRHRKQRLRVRAIAVRNGRCRTC